MRERSFIYPIIFMALITALFTFLLALLNHSTAQRIQLLEDTDLRKKILYVLDIAYESDEPEEIERLFNQDVKVDNSFEPPIYYTMEGGEVAAYALPASGPGLWGNIDAYVGISADFTSLLGLEFIKHSETPGLGGRISEGEFLEQFRGLDISSPVDGEYIIYRPAPGGNVDAIAGATQTSKSVRDLLNKDIDRFIIERRGK
ncbi:MAG: FMN-binding protein [Tissierellia bacterium]|nr:FMN-binding protein [Tissierellia bacterium]